MLPIKLTIQAFGAYNEKTEIDFSKLGKNNIFLIAGTTGSGKTTIFNAISYALFNVSTSTIRTNISLRSHYAKEDLKSFVEFSFLFNGEEYKVIRTLQYERKKQRGEGYTQVPATAELYLPNGKITEGTDKVDKKIIELLGINAMQFSQIALLAQGEFLKLLNCETNQRGEIFRTIFKTKSYNDFQKLLKEKTSKLNSELDLKKQLLVQGFLRINIVDETISDLISKIEEKKQFLDIEKIFLELEKQNENDEKNIKDKTELIKSNNDKIIENNKLLDKINLKKDIELKIKNINLEIQNKNKDFLLIENEFKKTDILAKDLENAKIELNQINDDFLKIEKINSLEAQISNFEAQNKEIETKINSNETSSIELKKNHLKFLFSNYLNFKNNLKTAQNDFNELKKDFKEQYDTYNSAYLDYLSIQAGLLAKNLTDNTPCPVCGSKTHPNKAKLKQDAITKEQLDGLKEKQEQLNSQLQLKSKTCTILNEQINAAKDNYERYLVIYNLKIDEEKITLELNLKDEGFIKQIDDLQIEITTLKKTEQEIKLQLSGLNSAKETILKSFKIKETDLIVKKRNELLNNIETIENSIKTIKANYDKTKIELSELKSKLEILNADLDNLKNVNTSEFEQITLQNEDLKNNTEKINTEISKLRTRYEINKEELPKLTKDYNNYLELEKDYLNYLTISNCANGTITGKPRIAFEQYIQSYYLDLILFEANKRLKVMTQNRFQFQRKKEFDNLKGKTGLEIEVMDFYTFKPRSTKTLSGGESFMAALSLALGLSDVISNRSGSINIDTMFIDEGFGSLDAESLELAMKVISDLSQNNRLIGIISHVDELKAKIENQIVTTKTQNGSIAETNFG